MENGGGVGFDYTQKILIEMGGEYSSVFTPDKRDIQKDDMGEYQDTCHEENLLACREREREGGRERERICTKGVGWRLVRDD